MVVDDAVVVLCMRPIVAEGCEEDESDECTGYDYEDEEACSGC